MSTRKGEEALQALLAAVAPIGGEIEGGESETSGSPVVPSRTTSFQR